jgi:phage terminase small subunit
MAALKERQEKFCQFVIFGKTYVDAFVEAGYSPNATRASQLRAAKRLMKRPAVVVRLAELKELTVNALIMDVTERKVRLSEIGRARITDFVEVKDNIAVLKVDLESVNSAAIQEVTTEINDTGSIVTVTKLKLRDPVPAMQELSKLCGDYAPEKHELTGKDGEPIQLEIDAKTKLFGLIVNGATRMRNQAESSGAIGPGSAADTPRLDGLGKAEPTSP